MNKKNIYYWCITRPVGTILLSAALVLLGILAYLKLPVASLPETDFPTINVRASLAGASPQTMASSVATPLEVELSNIPGITEMISTSSTGSVSLTLQFTLDKDINVAAQEVQAALNTASRKLPSDMSSAPTWRKNNPADTPILVLSVTSPSMNINEMSDYTETILARQISQIDGVGEVLLWGLRRPAIRIHASPQTLVAADLTLQDVRETIQRASVNLPKGSIYGHSQTSMLQTNDQIFTPEEYGNLIIKWENGQPVYIKDVAKVFIGAENEFTALRTVDNALDNTVDELGISIIIRRQPGANIPATVDRIQAALPELQAMLPESINVNILNDRTRTIRASLHEVQLTLAIAVLLVIGVMALFLRQKAATLIVSTVLGVTLISTCAFMYLMGFSLNNLTLVAIVISVGFIVDDAIIVVENIHRYLEKGLSRFEATLKSMQEIGFTVFSISISLVAVFIPLLFMGGVVGKLFREFALTATSAIMISVVICLTLAPSLAALYMNPPRKKHPQTNTEPEQVNQPSDWFDSFIRFYDKRLRWVLAHTKTTLLFFFITLAISITGFFVIPKGFFPLQDTGFMSISTKAASDISFEDMYAKHMQIAEILKADPDIARFNNSVGGSSTIGNGFFMVVLNEADERKTSVHDIITRLRPQFEKIPGINVFMRAAQDINVGAGSRRAQYFYTLRTQNSDELAQWAEQLTAQLKQDPLFKDVSNDLEWDAHVYNITIDREAATQYGLTPQDIDNALYNAFGQRQINEIQTEANQYKIILSLDEQKRGQVESLDLFYLRSPLTGDMVPLSRFTKQEPPTLGAVAINHLDMQPAANISFNLEKDVSLSEAVKRMDDIVREMHMPENIFGSFQGTAQVFQDSLATQPLLILAAILAVYIILGVLYESFIHPITILSTLPSAGIGAILFLYLWGLDFSIMALIGVILLIGIVKKNGILLIDFALHAMREQKLSAQEAIHQACLIRFRPILMTTIAAILGAIPLIFALGTGAELRQPLGVTIVGGLLISQLLTLFSTPVIFLTLHNLFSKENKTEQLR